MRYAVAVLSLAVISAAVVSLLYPADTTAERLARHLNLGKAFYENPATPKEAVEEFRQALALAPSSAREHLNFGLALLRAGLTEQGVAELEQARSMDASLPHPYFNLGVVFKKAGEFPRAIREFEQMARLVPDEPVTHYNLGALHKIEGRLEQAVKEFQTAARLDPTLAAPHFQLFNAYRVAKQPADAQRELDLFQQIKKRQAELGGSEDMDWSYYSEILEVIEPAGPEAPEPVEVTFEEQRVGTLGGPGTGIAALDADTDGHLDVLAWSAGRVALFRNTARGFVAVPIAGAAGPVAVGDFNNDGFPDLCAGARLVTNRKGAFVAEAKPLAAGSFSRCLWIDYDHDYDHDLMLLGAGPVLLRNNGDGSWADVSSTFPFAAGEPRDAVVVELAENNGFDVVVAYRDRPAVLYRDRKAGRYEAAPLGFPLAAPLEVADLNQDGFLDLVAGGDTRVDNHRGTLRLGPKLPVRAAAFADFQNRGRLDPRGLPGPVEAAVAAEFTGDHLTDAAVLRPDGVIHVLRNVTPVKNAWMKITLTGIKNPKLAAGARVEVKAGRLYQKKVYQGVPLVFGLGAYAQADTVRITWPNGLIQNEPRQAANANYNYKEAQRLSGSCPMIFTWNGERFEFISDVLGVAPLGAGLGDGQYFPVDHDEYIQIPARSLRPLDGMYDVRITEELREVSYLDQVELIAVDHPEGIEIFTNDKFQSPPFPEFRLFGVDRRIYPRSVRREPEPFRRDMRGRAETHSLTLDFPPGAAPAVLFLRGWVDWADGSTFVAASQGRSMPLTAPYLQVEDARGRWVTVIEDMGMPAGKPKTIAVDLGGKFLSASRRIRIVTGMCVYWEEAFLGEHAANPPARLTRLGPAAADLRFRGFSAVRVDPHRRRPESFDYSVVRPAAMWNPTPGLYTRYGDVRTLLASIDDRFVLLGSGDEVRLRFAAAALPPLDRGWTRDFLLLVDGYAKDADPNTAFGSTVEPLPFHAMSRYPYPAGQRHPDEGYARRYNTRPAVRLIRPLVAP